MWLLLLRLLLLPSLGCHAQTTTSVISTTSSTSLVVGLLTGLPFATVSEPSVVTAWNLTTTFVPPTECLGPTYTAAVTGGGSNINRNSDLTTNTVSGRENSCYPPHFGVTTGYTFVRTSQYPDLALSYVDYYFPGICPSGYTSIGGSRDLSLSYTNCCPLVGGITTTTVSVNNGTCYATSTFDGTASPVVIANNYSISEIVLPRGGVVLMQDEVVSVANYLSTTSITAATSSPSASSVSSTSTASPGLSTGAEAGIGVEVSLGAIAVIGVVFLAWRIRKNRREATGTSDYEKAELPDNSKPTPQLQGEEVHEIGSNERKPEIDGTGKAELDATWHGYELDGTDAEQKGQP